MGGVGGQPGGNLFCIFDGHGNHGRRVAEATNTHLPGALSELLAAYFAASGTAGPGTRAGVQGVIEAAFAATDAHVRAAGINVSSSGTTATVAFQLGNQLWVAAAGDSRSILCSRAEGDGGWRARPLTLDHRPRRLSERVRVEAAGGRVEPKRLPGGRVVGEPRLWLQDLPTPGLLLTRALGDTTAASIGCTHAPETVYCTLRAGVDVALVIASDGIWDCLENGQVCDVVAAAAGADAACQAVLAVALEEWEDRLAGDNISIVVARFGGA